MRNIFQNKLLNSSLLIQLSFYIKLPKFDVLSFLVIFYAVFQHHDKVAILRTSVLLEFKYFFVEWKRTYITKYQRNLFQIGLLY